MKTLISRFSRSNNLVSGLIAIGIVSAIALGCTCGKNFDSGKSPSSPSQPSAANNVRKTGEEFVVGYMQYKVFDSWYTNKLSDNQFLNKPPDAQYLFVDLGVGNVDKEERTVPPFKLIDENGAEYGTSDRAWAVEGSIGLLQNLNPGVAKRAYVIFDVPQGRQYKIKLSGGYWSGDDALVELNPGSNKGQKRK